MKNLLVYLSPTKQFDPECAILSKIQIDNSLSLGWKKEDILLITNFPYEYNGVKAIVVPDEHFCAVRPRSIKTAIVPYLIDAGIITSEHLYWNHDFDAYEVDKIEESELGLEDFELGLTDYGWRERWCLGCAFFKTSARDIFEVCRDEIFKNIEDETVMVGLTTGNVNNINTRMKKLNITYQIGKRHVASNVEKATKPLKILHFHPAGLMDTFRPLMPDRLQEIFSQHGFK